MEISIKKLSTWVSLIVSIFAIFFGGFWTALKIEVNKGRKAVELIDEAIKDNVVTKDELIEIRDVICSLRYGWVLKICKK